MNPALPTEVRSILFVCLGNICRSPFAGLLAGARLPELKVTSAGIRTTQSNRSPREACDAAERYGVSLREHQPIPLTAELIAAHDLIIVMEAGQRQLLRRMFPWAANKVFLLSLFDGGASGYERYHIDDPFSRPRSAYDTCYSRIERAVSALVDAIHPTTTARRLTP